MINSVSVIVTDFGEFRAPPTLAEAAKTVKWRKRGNWPDMRTKAGKRWVELFKAFSEQKRQEYINAA